MTLPAQVEGKKWQSVDGRRWFLLPVGNQALLNRFARTGLGKYAKPINVIGRSRRASK